MQALICPLCHGTVQAGSSGCRTCHLPVSDVVRHGGASRSSRGGLGRAVSVRLSGLVLYAAAVWWCQYALSDALPFVVPGAVLGGGVLHVWKGRPWLGLAVFVFFVVAFPALLWPALGTGTFLDMTDWC